MKEYEITKASELIDRKYNVKEALTNVKKSLDEYSGSRDISLRITSTHTTNRTKKVCELFLNRDKLIPVLEQELIEINSQLKKLEIRE